MVITGASSGIGQAAAVELSERGATVAVVGRNPERTMEAAQLAGGVPFVADFARLDDVRRLADDLLARFDRIDVLANNAGGLSSPRSVTVDGFERIFQTNHLAPFLLTELLLPRIIESRGRVLATSSNSNNVARLDLTDLGWQSRPWLGGWRAYGTSKLAAILFTKELARLYGGEGLTAYSFHPGYVASRFGDQIGVMNFAQVISAGRLGLSPQQGSAPLVFLASTEDVGAPNGSYFDKLRAGGRTNRSAEDSVLARELWDASTNLVGAR